MATYVANIKAGHGGSYQGARHTKFKPLETQIWYEVIQYPGSYPACDIPKSPASPAAFCHGFGPMPYHA